MPVEIACMSPADYDAVLSLWLNTEGMGLSDADSRDETERYLARNPGMSFVAKDNGRVIATALCGHDGRRGYLHHLAVAPSYRHRGIGAAMAERCLAALREAGIRKCHLFVFAENKEGLAFWQQTGWTLRKDLETMSKSL